MQYESIQQLNVDCLQCHLCGLRDGATQVVPGEGNPQAKIMFIGEGPGATEDKLGRPFVGAAGKFLDELLKSINLQRVDVFIANTVKCRPPENRDPSEEEKLACKPWLDEQIRLINPSVFVPLGRHALHSLLPEIAISNAHGKLYKVEDKIVFAMYHPAVALYNGGMRPALLKDMQNLKSFLEGKLSPEPFIARSLHKTASSKVHDGSKVPSNVQDLIDRMEKKKSENKSKTEDESQITLF
jgi:DNA polymerase